MKTTVQYSDIREFELKPGETLGTYLRLTESDVQAFFLNGPLTDCACPACMSESRVESFVKFGLQYCECARCGTLYVSPRPSESAVDAYFQKSKAHQFWGKQLSSATKAKRREKVFKPRVDWIIDTVEEYYPSARRIRDVNSIHLPFLEELAASKHFKELVAVNPRVDLAGADFDQGTMEIVSKPIGAVPGKADAVTLFEVIDRLSDVGGFFGALERAMVPGGLCFLTTISISGFDLQVLWEKSHSIFPPDRMNAFSIQGLTALVERHGFECIELSTPGILDVQIVASALRENPQLELPRFVKYLLTNRDAEAQQSFQEFLQMNRMSSFVRAVLRKK